MKRYIKLAGVLLISGLVACEDYLDVNPEMGITAEEIYSDYYNFKGAVDRATNLIHNYVFDRYDWDCEVGGLSDEAQSVKSAPTMLSVNTGLWQDYSGREFGFKN